LTYLVGKVKNGYIGIGAEIVRLAKVAAMLRAKKEVGRGSGPSGSIFR